MKFTISESKMYSVIFNYLTHYVHPDYNWGPELHDFYQEDVKKYGMYDFLINDDIAYTYHGYQSNPFNDELEEIGVLFIESWLANKLTTLFGNFWQPVFKDWFEENSGLEVQKMSNINESDIIKEDTLIDKIKKLESIASDDMKESEIYKKLMSLFNTFNSEDYDSSSLNGDVISGSYSAEGKTNPYDALHSFQSRKSDKFGGRINTKVEEGILEYKKSNGIDSVDIKKVDIDIDPNSLKVNWKVTIGPSTDGYTYEEFDSRGSAGGGESAVNSQLSSMHSNHSGTPKLVYHYNKIIPICFDSNGVKKSDGCKGSINIQQKFFKYGKKI